MKKTRDVNRYTIVIINLDYDEITVFLDNKEH